MLSLVTLLNILELPRQPTNQLEMTLPKQRSSLCLYRFTVSLLILNARVAVKTNLKKFLESVGFRFAFSNVPLKSHYLDLLVTSSHVVYLRF